MSRLARQLPKLGTRETEALSVELTAIVRFVTPGLPPSKAGERHLAPGRHGADAPLRDPEALRVVRPQDLALVRHLAIGDRHRALGLERLDRLPGQDVAGDHARPAAAATQNTTSPPSATPLAPLRTRRRFIAARPAGQSPPAVRSRTRGTCGAPRWRCTA